MGSRGRSYLMSHVSVLWKPDILSVLHNRMLFIYWEKWEFSTYSFMNCKTAHRLMLNSRCWGTYSVKLSSQCSCFIHHWLHFTSRSVWLSKIYEIFYNFGNLFVNGRCFWLYSTHLVSKNHLPIRNIRDITSLIQQNNSLKIRTKMFGASEIGVSESRWE